MKLQFKQLGKNQWLIILLIGVLLVIIALPTEEKENKTTEDTTVIEQTVQDKNEMEEYQKKMEQQLEALLSQMEGVGKVQVMVTLSGSSEMVVEKDVPQVQSQIQEGDASGGSRTTKENTWEESTVYLQKDGDSIPYVIKELVPKVEGVCVIAEGGGNGTVAKNISEAVQALFSIEVHKIKVMKMK